MNKVINTPKAPKAIGPYSQAILAGNGMLFISGQIPVNPETGKVPETITEHRSDIDRGRIQLQRCCEDHLFVELYGRLCCNERSICQILQRNVACKSSIRSRETSYGSIGRNRNHSIQRIVLSID